MLVLSSMPPHNPVLLLLAGGLLLTALWPPRWGLNSPAWVRGLLGLAAAAVLALALRDTQEQPPVTEVPDRDCLALLAPARLAHAAAPSSAVAPSGKAPMGLLSGPQGLTYHDMMQALAHAVALTGNAAHPLQLAPLESTGTLDNIRRINSPENAGAGPVQGDVLPYLPHSMDATLSAKVGRLRLVLPMHTEEVHLLVRSDRGLNAIAALNGRRVLVPRTSEGARVSAENLLRLSQLSGLTLDAKLDAAEAICEVVNGKADAVFITAGQPVPLLSKLAALSPRQLRQITFVPLHDGRSPTPEGYQPAVIKTYPWHPAPVHSLAVRALLVAYDFSNNAQPHYRQRCEDLRRLGAALPAALKHLRQSGHAKWVTVEPDVAVSGWTLDRCAWPGGVRPAFN